MRATTKVIEWGWRIGLFSLGFLMYYVLVELFLTTSYDRNASTVAHHPLVAICVAALGGGFLQHLFIRFARGATSKAGGNVKAAILGGWLAVCSSFLALQSFLILMGLSLAWASQSSLTVSLVMMDSFAYPVLLRWLPLSFLVGAGLASALVYLRARVGSLCESEPPPRRKERAALALGVISALLFWLPSLGLPLAVAAIVIGVSCMLGHRDHYPQRVLAGIGTVLGLVGLLRFVLLIA